MLEKITNMDLSCLHILQVKPESYKGSVQKLASKHGVTIRHGEVDMHRDQGIVER